MAKCITFGKFNRSHKYILFFIIIKFINEYFFGSYISDKVKIISKKELPKPIIIQYSFSYLFTFIYSVILYIFGPSELKEETSLFKKKKKEGNNIGNKNDQLSNIIIIFIILLLIICDLLFKTFYNFTLKGLNYWMLELLFVSLISLKIFETPLYKHKIFAIMFIILFCSTLKILSIIFRIKDNEKLLYREYKWIIPIGIIIFNLILLLRSYVYCKIKWILQYKCIPLFRLLVFYGFFGTCICFIISSFASSYSCADKNTFQNIEFFCNITSFDNSTNTTTYYYDSYSIFFKNLWKQDKDIYINILFLLLFIFKSSLPFFIILYLMMIINYLSPEYSICANSIQYFFAELIDYIYFVYRYHSEETDIQYKYYKFFGTLGQFFSSIGCLIYLEIIELNFCKLNENLSKNIKDRGSIEKRLDYEIEKEFEDNEPLSRTLELEYYKNSDK